MSHSNNNPEKTRSCPLCSRTARPFISESFFRCSFCEGIFRNPDHHLPPETERKRYEQHNNDPEDPGYQRFVLPLVNAITSQEKQDTLGLDFGAGPGPVVSKMLANEGYRDNVYDPFFHNDPLLLEQIYDYIFCCEVIEHFFSPATEFKRLKSLIRPGGRLYCMTHIHTDEIDFSSWYYKNDATHVFFYREKTLRVIEQLFGFSSCTIDGRIIVFETPGAETTYGNT